MTALLIRTGNPAALPLDLLLSAIPSLPRPSLERLTARMIEVLDTMDGDPDLELNGDELDGSLGEDDFHNASTTPWTGPGCPISDPGGDTLDEHGECPSDDGTPLLQPRPIYGPDQSTGPINHEDGYREWQRQPGAYVCS